MGVVSPLGIVRPFRQPPEKGIVATGCPRDNEKSPLAKVLRTSCPWADRRDEGGRWKRHGSRVCHGRAAIIVEQVNIGQNGETRAVALNPKQYPVQNRGEKVF
jgi:hypothetical protein